MKLKSGLLALAVFTILLIQSTNIFAQGGGAFDDQKSIKQMTPKDRLKIANDLFDAGSFYNAIEYYKEYLADESGNPEATFKLAEAYRFSRDYRKAEDWYKRAYKADEAVNILALYYQALMMKYNCKYVEAKPIFLEFVKKYKEDEGKEIRKRARMEAAGCEDALVLMQSPLKLNVYHLGSSINNPYSDFGPAADGNDALTYATIKSDTVVAVGGPTRASYVCRIYRSTRNGSKWNKGKEYGEYINDDQEHTGNPAFSANRRVMVFSRCKEKSATDLHITCELYMCTRSTENAKWAKPVKLGPEVNEPGSTNTQPTIGRSESGDNYLYFVSDRKSSTSQGGLDIWYASIKRDGSTGTAFNCGKKLNTTEDDCTPFFDDKNGQLYFSSNGRVGMGGFDIYYAKGWGKKWEAPENVGYPINSCVDDRYFTLTPNHKGGYFVSNRTGGFELKSPTCCDDIFEFKYIIDPVFAVKGYVFSSDDQEKKHPLEKVQVILLNNDQTFIGKDSSTRKRLKYFFNTQRDQSYIIKVGKEGYFTSSATFTNVGKTESDTQRIDIFIKPIIIKPIKIQGLFYDFDKATLRAESGPALDTLLSFLRENPTIKIQINSHTDNKGSDEYNMKLSQARAQSVVDYLTGHGIAGERLSAKGYGETDPLVPNSNPNGTDNPENRQLNRRTEFMIIGSVEGAIITYEQGRPVVIDSTASTHELNERERNGKTRAQLNDSPDGFLDNNPNGAPIMNDDIFATEPNGEKRKIEFDDKPIEAPVAPAPVAPKPQPAPKPVVAPTTTPTTPVNKNTEDDEDEIAPAPKVAPAKPTPSAPKPATPVNTVKPTDDEDEDAAPPTNAKTAAPKPAAVPTTAPKTNVTNDEDEDEMVTKPKVEQPKVEQPKPAPPVVAPTPAAPAVAPVPAPPTPAPAAPTTQPRKTNIADEDEDEDAKPTVAPQPKTETPKSDNKAKANEDEDETSTATPIVKVDDKKALKEKKKAEEKIAAEKKKAEEKAASEKKKAEEKAKKEASKTTKKVETKIEDKKPATAAPVEDEKDEETSTPKKKPATTDNEDEDAPTTTKVKTDASAAVKTIDSKADKKALEAKKKAEEKAAEEAKKAADKLAKEKKKAEEQAKKEEAKKLKDAAKDKKSDSGKVKKDEPKKPTPTVEDEE